jgi:hypothetical protein
MTVLVFAACNHSGVHLFFKPENGDNIFVRTVCLHLQDNMVSRLRQLQYENLYYRGLIIVVTISNFAMNIVLECLVCNVKLTNM